MHKKLASDLISLAHSILKMKDKEDVIALKEKAAEVYEKLSVLAYVEEYINTTPQADVSKEELLKKIEEADKTKHLKKSTTTDKKTDKTIVTEKKTALAVNKAKENIVSETLSVTKEKITPEVTKEAVTPSKKSKETTKNKVEEITEQPFDELENIIFEKTTPQKKETKETSITKKTPTLEEELEDTLPVDVMANLFEKAESKKSLNDQLQKTIQIGLNDRIAFVKHLFEGNQNDFNRVISQLNTFKTETEAKKFITKLVKPDYNWGEKEEYETRLIEIIERRFS